MRFVNGSKVELRLMFVSVPAEGGITQITIIISAVIVTNTFSMLIAMGGIVQE